MIRRYGKDRTFSVPILTHCALAGTVPWKRVIPLPFELACVPAAPACGHPAARGQLCTAALIAIGQAVFKHRKSFNPLTAAIRRRRHSPFVEDS
ncbi:MAG UNVERIFIED_CONTAM: hypothetical protein LVR18_44450 [Planctomycetaceae bacterium]